MARSLRSVIKNGLSSNILIYDNMMKIYYREFNNNIEECVGRLSGIDSIEDFALFRKEMMHAKFPETSGTFTIKRSYSENTLYGYATIIMKFAGIDLKEMRYMPILLHGVPYDSDFNVEKFAFHNSFIFQGLHDVSRVKKYYPQKRIYTIGPFIHYADSYYNEAKIKEKKAELGTTALIFLNHSTEQLEASMQVNRKIEYIEKTAKRKYDTYIVCVYCQDVMQICDKDIDEKGILYVSAGYKLDQKFCTRLKSIIELSDDVYFDGFSSSIGYAYLMKKNVYSLEKNVILNRPLNRIEEFAELFYINNHSSSNEQNEYIDRYWGISQIKSKEEIRAIHIENKERIKRRFGFFI